MVTVFTHALRIEHSLDVRAFCDLPFGNLQSATLLGLFGLPLLTGFACLTHGLLLSSASLWFSNGRRGVAKVVATLALAFLLVHLLVIVSVEAIVDFLLLRLASRTFE